MLHPHQLHDYQKKAVNFQCTLPHSALFLDTGLGKTGVTLTSIAHLMTHNYLKSVVIVAPVRVCKLVWRQEALKWSHTQHLKFSMLTGSKDQRSRALLQPADVYLINYENLGWLAEALQTYFKDRPLPFDGIVFDELSKMKNSTTQRVKSLKKVLPLIKWKTGLTGTPASNGYQDLHGQFLVLDGGERLGTSKTQFKTRFYKKVRPFKEVPYEDTETTIKQLISDITLNMSAEDYLKMPDLITNDVSVELPEQYRSMYDRMEQEFFVQLDSGTEIELFNKAGLTNKCLQFSAGAMYPVAGLPAWEHVHDVKMDALEDIIDEANGQPVLCFYAFRFEAERMMERFKKIKPINMTACKSEKELSDAMSRWQSGDCKLMVAHPLCLGADTQVFTERNGWINIIDVHPSDRVFDGVEFVHHQGCHYSGFKEVINLFGITMTPDHKLFINREWVEAKNVPDTRESRYQATFKRKNYVDSKGKVFELWKGIRNDASECNSEQSRRTRALCTLFGRYIPSYDRFKILWCVAWDEVQSFRQNGQKLRRSWDNCIRRMDGIYKFLQRYVGRLFGRTDNRTDRCEWELLQGKLSMGYCDGTTFEQTKQSELRISRRKNTLSRIMSKNWFDKDDVTNEIESGYDSGRSSVGCSEFTLWEKSRSEKCDSPRKEDVYDLVNCGPRHQFLIRNSDGDMFISHNSVGFGIDGLQKNGHIMVWTSLTWSLEAYMQAVARLHRQGQGAPVICHRIIMKDTLDQAQALALAEKADNQNSLRKAIQEYRQMRKW